MAILRKAKNMKKIKPKRRGLVLAGSNQSTPTGRIYLQQKKAKK
ncbi:MAG TPA: hypothetical protein VMW95_06585 [Desulfobacterales bacterium]|nr:hypothetical protein [Desulfobacterales bacterium]